MQPWCIPFPIWNQSVVPCPVRTVASWLAFRLQTKSMGSQTFQECSNYQTIVLTSHASKDMLRIVQDRCQQYFNRELQMSKLSLEKAEESESNCWYLLDHRESRGIPEKQLFPFHWKPLTVWITTNCRKFLKRWEYQTTLPVFWETCMRVKKQQLELNMEQWTGSKLGKEYVKAVYCHPAFLTSMNYNF